MTQQTSIIPESLAYLSWGEKLYRRMRRSRRDKLTRIIRQATGDVVADGPFVGMRLLPVSSWGDGDVAPKLLGSYEADLAPPLLEAVATQPKVAVVVGCAEGYYAVGLARLLPESRLHAYDSDSRAQNACRAAAEANGVAGRVTVGGTCSAAGLAEMVADQTGLVVVDCEGCEAILLDGPALPALRRSWIIVECHDFLVPGVTELLSRRFAATHAIQRIDEGPRDPNRLALLRGWHSHDRWLAITEGRPITMHWLVLRPLV
mgnify:CR=1 FL=1